MNSLPRWAKYAVFGAIVAVAMDYFVQPAAKRTVGL